MPKPLPCSLCSHPEKEHCPGCWCACDRYETKPATLKDLRRMCDRYLMAQQIHWALIVKMIKQLPPNEPI